MHAQWLGKKLYYYGTFGILFTTVVLYYWYCFLTSGIISFWRYKAIAGQVEFLVFKFVPSLKHMEILYIYIFEFSCLLIS